MILWLRLALHLRGTSHWTWPVYRRNPGVFSRDLRHPKSVLFCFFVCFPREGTNLPARTWTVFCFPKTTSVGPKRPLVISPIPWNSLMTSDSAGDRPVFMRHGFETTLVFNVLALQFLMVHSSFYLSSGEHRTPHCYLKWCIRWTPLLSPLHTLLW